MSVVLGPWMRCPSCRRLHVRAFITTTTECVCGTNLHAAAWERKKGTW